MKSRRRICVLSLFLALWVLDSRGDADPEAPCVNVRFRIADRWPTGYCVYVHLENPTGETFRNLGFTFRVNAQIRGSWVGQYTQEGGLVTVTLPDFAATLAPGRTSTESGFCADGSFPTDIVVTSGGIPVKLCNGCVVDTMVAPADDVNEDGYLDPCEGCVVGTIGCSQRVTGELDWESCTFTDGVETPAIEVYRLDLAEDRTGIRIDLASTDERIDTQLVVFDAGGEEIVRSDRCGVNTVASCLEGLDLSAGTYFIGVTTLYSANLGGYELGLDCGDVVKETPFVRGDVDGDGSRKLTDPIYLLNFLFLSGSWPDCEKAADADDTGNVDVTDAIYLLSFLFLGGPEPPPPFPDCGLDPTIDELACASFDACP